MSSSISPISPGLPEGIELASSIEIDRQLAANVDYLLRLKDPRLAEPLRHYNNYNQTLSALLSLSVVCTVCGLPIWILNGIRMGLRHTTMERAGTSLAMGTWFILSVSLWVIYFKQRAVITRNGGVMTEACKTYLQTVHSIAFAVINAIICIRLIIKSASGECTGDSYFANWNCNTQAVAHSIPIEYALLAMLAPIVYSTTVRGAHFGTTMFLWIMSVGGIVVSMVVAKATETFYFFGAYVLISLYVLIEHRRQLVFHTFDVAGDAQRA